MRNNLVSFALATAAGLHLPYGVNAARPCGGTTGGSFQYRLGDVRYDGPDPAKNNDLATIAASLQGNTGTPLYECVGQWPETWAGWYQGAENIGRLIDTQCPGGPHDMVLVPTRANGQPAYGLYMRGPDGDFTPFHLQVLTITDGAVSHVGAFFEPDLFATFGLPPVLTDEAVPR